MTAPRLLPPDDTARRRRSTRIKVRAYRQRQRAGLAVLKVPVLQYETVQYLIGTGRVSVAEALDPNRVGHACGQLLAELAARWSEDL